MRHQNLLPLYALFGEYWLREVQAGDIAVLHQLPEFAEALIPPGDSAGAPLVLPAQPTSLEQNLRVEFQRLFGFNLPPYESIFVDPAAMLDSPATQRVQTTYRRLGWAPPAGVRVAAADHLGLQMLALAERGTTSNGANLLTEHLALWAPVFLLTLQRLDPHPFYAVLADLSLELILESLAFLGATAADRETVDPFPVLPPAPVYRGTQDGPATVDSASGEADDREDPSGEARSMTLNAQIRRLLTACQSGFYLTRLDLARMATRLQLPVDSSDRFGMLRTLLEMAAQYEALAEMQNELLRLLEGIDGTYASLLLRAPAWKPYAQAWRRRVAMTHEQVAALDMRDNS